MHILQRLLMSIILPSSIALLASCAHQINKSQTTINPHPPTTQPVKSPALEDTRYQCWDPTYQLGCATRINLNAMIANPRDFYAPKATTSFDANVLAQAVERYQNGTNRQNLTTNNRLSNSSLSATNSTSMTRNP